MGKNDKKQGGITNPDMRGSVAEAIKSTEDGRARKRAERKQNEANRAARRMAEDARKRAEQVTDPQSVAIFCERIFSGAIGDYNLFGLELAVRMHDGRSEEYPILTLTDALYETDILKSVEPGTFVPISLVRMNPQRVTWRSNQIDRAKRAFCEYLHAQVFGQIATTLRRQHFAEVEKSKQQQLPPKSAHLIGMNRCKVSNAKKKEVVCPFNEKALCEPGSWRMSDGAVVRTWFNPKGALCAAVRAVPDATHKLAGYNIFVKVAHLQLEENDMFGKELREYLRKHVAALSAPIADAA